MFACCVYYYMKFWEQLRYVSKTYIQYTPKCTTKTLSNDVAHLHTIALASYQIFSNSETEWVLQQPIQSKVSKMPVTALLTVDVNEELFCQARGVTPFQNPALAIKPTSDFLHHPINSPTQFLNNVFTTTGVTFGHRAIFPCTPFFFQYLSPPFPSFLIPSWDGSVSSLH